MEKVPFAVKRDWGVGGGATINRNFPGVNGCVTYVAASRKKICPTDNLNKQL